MGLMPLNLAWLVINRDRERETESETKIEGVRERENTTGRKEAPLLSLSPTN